ncbi:MAG: hypothetical protein J6D26_02040 [Clostridia bacterium]|nr:hypothetical protein [Clostridia bacterium]
MKRFLIIITVLLCTMLLCLTVYAASSPPEIDSALLEYGAERGTEIAIPNFDLTKTGAKFNSKETTAYTTFHSLDGTTGCYMLTPKTGRNVLSQGSMSLKPNRNYILTALIYSDYSRDNCEVDIILKSYDKDGNLSHSNRIGTPAKTDGWQRIEKTFTTGAVCNSGLINIALYGFSIPDNANSFYISDLHIIELPAEEITPLSPGEGMIFGGSSGKYNMKVSDVTTGDETITVKTTAVKFVFNKSDDTVLISQHINTERNLVSLTLNKSLQNLSLLSKSDNEAVLTTGEGGVTFGVQMDSMMLISNHGDTDLQINCESVFKGDWNRSYQGHVVSKDDLGGFTINPYIPLGTGRLCRYTVSDDVDFDNVYNNPDFVTFSQAGWYIDYQISSGELLGVSIFPAREYDWQDSFESTYINYYKNGNTARFAQDAELYGVDVGVFWDYTKKSWGMSYGNIYEVASGYESKYKTDIAEAHNNGIKVAPYMSMYFWYNRDIDEYINEVKRHRDTYGIDGVYTDGTPDIEWLAAYEGARRLRELFPDGPIIVHQTGKHGNGGPPAGLHDMFIPAIDSYFTITLRGEDIPGEGIDWSYAREIAPGYNVSNAIGLLKGNAWMENDEVMPEYKQNLISLLYNGRARVESRDEGSEVKYASLYDTLLQKLRINYLVHQNRSDYYNEHYLPFVHKLIREDDYYGSEIEEEKGTKLLADYDFTKSSHLSSWSVDSGSMSSVSIEPVDGVNALCVDDGGGLNSKGAAVKNIGKQSGRLRLDIDVRTDASGSAQICFNDANGNSCMKLLMGNGIIRATDNTGSYDILESYEADTWHNITIIIDCGRKTFMIMKDDVTIAEDMHFYYKSGVPQALVLASSDTGTTTAYFSNLELLQGF